MKLFSTFALVLLFASCATDSSKDDNQSTTADENEQTIPLDTVKAKSWLSNVIEDYTNSSDPNNGLDKLRQSLTESYYQFKMDAIGVEYDNGDTALTKETFKKKWQHKYDTEYAGYGGFLISAQDNGKVKVTGCKFLLNPNDSTALFKVVITDIDYKTEFHRDIKVVERDGRFLIDGVKEYD